MTSQELAHIHALCFTSPRPWSAQEFDHLRVSRSILLVQETGGFLIGRVVAGEAEILTLAVHPHNRRQGIGARLLQDFEHAARGRNASRFVLEVSDDNAPAHALYRKNGYEQAGFRKDYYASPDGKKSSAIVMVKEEAPG